MSSEYLPCVLNLVWSKSIFSDIFCKALTKYSFLFRSIILFLISFIVILILIILTARVAVCQTGASRQSKRKHPPANCPTSSLHHHCIIVTLSSSSKKFHRHYSLIIVAIVKASQCSLKSPFLFIIMMIAGFIMLIIKSLWHQIIMQIIMVVVGDGDAGHVERQTLRKLSKLD